MRIIKNFLLFAGLVLVVLGLTSCSLPATEAGPSADEELALMVSRTQTAIAVLQAATEAVEQPTDIPAATATLEQQATPSATPTTQPSPTATITPTPQPDDCTNKARLVSETIPDKTSTSASKSFTKTWTLQNVGTCIWTPDYSLVFVEGDLMSAVTPKAIGESVPPQGQAVLSIDLVAPSTSGVYQGNWMLRSTSGNEFGLGTNADRPFWVNITVVETSGELNLGNPSWTDNFDSDSGFWPLGKDQFLEFGLGSGALQLTAFQKTGDQWRLNGKPAVKNLFLEVNFRTGKSCSGKDSYGIVVRSTEAGDGVYDSGYVFTFSCDGMYRLYRMDDGTYIGLLNWTSSSDITPGADQSNRMGILVDGNLIKLYANGNRLAQVSDSGHAEGKWGLSIRAVDTSDFTVSVEDVAYWIFTD
jgi:hypothetical protein